MSANEDVNSTIRRFFCSNKTYNDMATLFFNPQETAIHQLFHQDGEIHVDCSHTHTRTRPSLERKRLMNLVTCAKVTSIACQDVLSRVFLLSYHLTHN